MAKHKTQKRIYSTDQKFLESLRDETEKYFGLRTALYSGELVIHLIDSDKYWRKRDRAERKRRDKEQEVDPYEQYPY